MKKRFAMVLVVLSFCLFASIDAWSQNEAPTDLVELKITGMT